MARHCILIADDHPLFRDALRQSLSTMGSTNGGGVGDSLSIVEAGSLDEATAAIERGGEGDAGEIDLVLLDLAIPGVKGFSGLILLRAQYPGIPVVIISGTEEPAAIRRAIEIGASGYIPKSVGGETMRKAIARVLAGDIWTPPDLDLSAKDDDELSALVSRLATLTPQQVRVLMMLGEGLLNKQIAYELSVSEATVKAHVSAILQKLDVDSRTQAVIAANKIDMTQKPVLEV